MNASPLTENLLSEFLENFQVRYPSEFRGALDGVPLMPRDASLSDSYKSVGDVFPVWQCFYTEKTILPFPFT